MRAALRRNRHARELDGAKEHLAYIKLWQGAVIVTEISLIGWLASASAGASPYIVTLGWIAFALLTFIAFMLHRVGVHYLKRIRSL
jgi:hypothetical protein